MYLNITYSHVGSRAASFKRPLLLQTNIADRQTDDVCLSATLKLSFEN